MTSQYYKVVPKSIPNMLLRLSNIIRILGIGETRNKFNLCVFFFPSLNNEICISKLKWKFLPADKQQELDLPTLRIEDSQCADPRVAGAASKKKEKGGPPGRAVPMSHISGVKRPLTHTNSFTGEKLPKHGVETAFEDELGKVSFIFVTITLLECDICSILIIYYI